MIGIKEEPPSPTGVQCNLTAATPLRIPVYNSTPNHQFQLQDWHNAHSWIRDCRPHCACQASFTLRGYCTFDYCPKHGRPQRIEKANRILSMGEPATDAYALTLPYGTMLAPNRIATARRHFLKTLQRMRPGIGVLWRLHFLNFVPHLNLTIKEMIIVPK
jgi:hypothetical protein